MKLKCNCGNIVATGNVDGKKFFMDEKPKGTILKNKSNSVNDWEAICSTCQKPKKENEKSDTK